MNEEYVCKKCGRTVYPGDDICMNCGNKLDLYNLVKVKKDSGQKLSTISVIVGFAFFALVMGVLIYFIF